MFMHACLLLLLQSCEGSGCPSAVDVFAQAPYYFGYISIVGQVPGARWNASADPSSPYTIEILTLVNYRGVHNVTFLMLEG